MPREALSFGLQPDSVPTITFSTIVRITLGVRPRRAPRAVPDPRPAPARSPAPLRPPRGRRTGRWSAVAPGALGRRPGVAPPSGGEQILRSGRVVGPFD